MSETQNNSEYGEILQEYVLRDGDGVKQVYVKYTIVSESIDLDSITSSSGITPTDFWHKGDINIRRHPITGQEAIAKRLNSVWSISTKERVRSSHLKDHLQELLSIVEPAGAFFKKICAKDSFRVYFSIYRECFDFQSLFSIHSDQLTRMIDLCKEIEFLCPVSASIDDTSE